MMDKLTHEHNGVPEFCQSLRTDGARFCRLNLFDGTQVMVDAHDIDIYLPALIFHDKTVGESDSYRKLCVNENKDIQFLIWTGVMSDRSYLKESIDAETNS